MNSIGNVLLVINAISTIPILVPSTQAGFACLSSPCLHGVCLDDLNTTYSCYCIDGYTGVQCQTNWDECWSNPCQNGGVCLDGIATFNCSCPAGFVGDVCEEDYNECESNPCLNNGTCFDGTNGYTCNCVPGYSGTHCEIDVAVCNTTNETRCTNGGICVEGPGVTFSCRCQPGWTGFLCDVEIDECMSDPCQNGAVCIDLHADYACACLFGFAGRNCDEVVLVCEDNPCENSALCLMEDEHPVCYCVPDYHGEKCQFQYDECQLGPRCMNGGTCIDGIDNFTCSCPPNLTGVLCECLIIDDHLLDCTYVSLTPSYPFTTATTLTSTITTLEEMTTTEITTTEVITTIPTKTESTITTELTTELTTTMELSTIMEPSTTTELSTTELITTELSTTEEFSTTTEVPTTTDFSTITTTDLTTESTTQTVPNINLTKTTTDWTIFDTTTELSSSTEVTIPVTIFTPNFTTEFITSTILTTIQFDTSTISSSTWNGRESNDTLAPDVTTTTFFTESPSTTEVFNSTESTPEILSTTQEYNFTVPPYFPDCSKNENRCKNGGSCVFTMDGHRCICPFDTDGPLCEHNLGIKNAAFGGDSFLSHKLNDKNKMGIEFKAKTTSSRGLIFYSNIDQTYMALYIENGYLKFKFSCGYQTMLLSELGKPVNNGYEMRINAELTFTRDFGHCNASIKLNNTLSMSGDQLALIDRYSKSNSWLYLGGVPNEYIKDKIQPGFVGCMSNLKISGKSMNIFKDAEDGFEVSECSSLACLSNPCQNNGVCSSVGDAWNCHCKNGYSGKMCDTSVCDNNPCKYGGTCLPYTGSGYICLCPFGKHGHFCENDLLITKPYFSSSLHGYSSYVAYQIPKGNFNRMEIKFCFSPTTLDQISILMFLGQKGRHDFHSDHMAVSFVKGYIMLTWNLGSGPRRIFTTKPIPPGKSNYLVHIGRFARRSWLYVENLGNVTGRSPGNLIQLDVVPSLYFGGHDSQNFSTLPHDLPLHSGFSGCIFDVEFKAGGISLPLHASNNAVGRALGQCGSTECHEKICQNGGACLYHGGTFTCLCQDGNYGPLCSSKYNLCDSFRNGCASGSVCVPKIADYECDCPMGKVGQFCEKGDTLTDVGFTGTRSYLTLAARDFELLKFNIEFELRPLKNRGVIFFIGKMDSFLSVSILSGLLELRIMAGRKRLHPNEMLIVRSNKLTVLGDWHTVRVGLYGRKVYLFVNNVVNTGILQLGETIHLSDQDIFIGGLPDLSNLPNDAVSFLPVPFTGCFRKLTINNLRIPLNNETIKISNNLIDCDGTPCGGDFCENSGSCWLDPNLKPHCACAEPFFGERCEKIPSCGEKICQHRGRCLNGKCACVVGWHGAFCENSIVVNNPKFKGNSFLLMNKSNKKRDTNNLKTVYLNFTTASNDGLILWSQKGNKYLGIGLEKGRLKLAYTTTEKNVEIPDINKLSDGLYHSLQLSFDPFNLTLDNSSIDVSNSHEIKENLIFPELYLGGVPENYKEANSVFKGSFEGCLESFGVNKNRAIKDFTEFEGENVENCVV